MERIKLVIKKLSLAAFVLAFSGCNVVSTIAHVGSESNDQGRDLNPPPLVQRIYQTNNPRSTHAISLSPSGEVTLNTNPDTLRDPKNNNGSFREISKPPDNKRKRPLSEISKSPKVVPEMGNSNKKRKLNDGKGVTIGCFNNSDTLIGVSGSTRCYVNPTGIPYQLSDVPIYQLFQNNGNGYNNPHNNYSNYNTPNGINIYNYYSNHNGNNYNGTINNIVLPYCNIPNTTVLPSNPISATTNNKSTPIKIEEYENSISKDNTITKRTVNDYTTTEVRIYELCVNLSRHCRDLKKLIQALLDAPKKPFGEFCGMGPDNAVKLLINFRETDVGCKGKIAILKYLESRGCDIAGLIRYPFLLNVNYVRMLTPKLVDYFIEKLEESKEEYKIMDEPILSAIGKIRKIRGIKKSKNGKVILKKLQKAGIISKEDYKKYKDLHKKRTTNIVNSKP